MLSRARRLVGGGPSGRMPSIGQDHEAGHRSYVSSLTDEGRRWLRTKPFSAPPTYELGRCLHSFAHIVDSLALGPGARVLDVGCGPGWISEWLARCGYAVTGVDISEDMLVVARERVAAITPDQLSLGATVTAEFRSVPVQELDVVGYFDAAILYDAMHHFDDEMTTLRAVARSLAPGGRIYIHEGVRPRPGSSGERELIEEMQRYGTLEAPFDPEYLVEVVSRSGFVDVRRLIEVDRLLTADRPFRGALRLARRLRAPTTNTIIATKPAGGGDRAELTLVGSAVRNGALEVRITARNTGGQRWTLTSHDGPSPGSVNVAPFLGGGEDLRELPRVPLPRAVDPGDAVTVDLRLPMKSLGDAGELGIDLVREQVAWFSEHGGTPLRVPLAR